MHKNRVFINKYNFVEIIVNGDQTVDSVQAMGDRAVRLSMKLHEQGKPVLVLDNLLHIGNVPPDARKRVVELAKALEYDKLAMVGKGTIIKLGANLMLQATGKGSRAKYFDDYGKAVEWLQLA